MSALVTAAMLILLGVVATVMVALCQCAMAEAVVRAAASLMPGTADQRAERLENWLCVIDEMKPHERPAHAASLLWRGLRERTRELPDAENPARPPDQTLVTGTASAVLGTLVSDGSGARKSGSWVHDTVRYLQQHNIEVTEVVGTNDEIIVFTSSTVSPSVVRRLTDDATRGVVEPYRLRSSLGIADIKPWPIDSPLRLQVSGCRVCEQENHGSVTGPGSTAHTARPGTREPYGDRTTPPAP
jgi:hypothetical protein